VLGKRLGNREDDSSAKDSPKEAAEDARKRSQGSLEDNIKEKGELKDSPFLNYAG